ncbi:SDR family oxidoreductase [Motilimonas sp. 1_MG-2023]|uniref:SDR family oxidoreductase n=1 Tax=Motilimonas TaxID=1914248 RepID=UPI0026E3CB40|nr:SDR family oxidoreductase [Motilimonas sp. 1_MG-2023]MDO6524930.1 SDR family oxidoreductase [Motilimonas sp. 1_MG-2023]
MNSTVLISGCSSGIGLYCAAQLQQAGFQVFATARKKSDLAHLRAIGCQAIYMEMSDPQSIQLAVDEILTATNGKLDILFNNAAFGQPGAVEDLPTQALREQFETNLFGWHELTKLIIPVMRRQGHGRIIQNSSVLGLVAMKYRGAYNASKFALEGLTDTLRLELAGSGIHVCLIEPGPIKSQFRHNALRAFHQHINIANSHHQQAYENTIARLSASESSSAFTLEPIAVFRALKHAIQAPKPKARYYVTLPTYVFALLRRVLPTRWLDYLLNKSD